MIGLNKNVDYKIVKCHNNCLSAEKVDPNGDPICNVCKKCGEKRTNK